MSEEGGGDSCSAQRERKIDLKRSGNPAADLIIKQNGFCPYMHAYILNAIIDPQVLIATEVFVAAS